MSIKVKPSNQARSYSAARGFSSASVGSYAIPRTSGVAPITPVTINKDLLTPLKIDIDPSVQTVRIQEKEQIKTLNNRFISLIEQVRSLEQQNKALETKWELLQGQGAADSSVEPMMKFYVASLQKQLQALGDEKQRLESGSRAMRDKVDEYREMYEQECNRKTDAENDFVVLKKDVDTSYLTKKDLEAMMSALSNEIHFLKALYDEELHELQENMKETSVMVEMDNSRDLIMDPIIAHIKAQYEQISVQSRKEAESWYKTKFDQMTVEADQHHHELRSTKAEISELRRRIKKLQDEISTAKAECDRAQEQVDDAEARGAATVADAGDRVRELEAALQQAKQAMARQIREYQDLMNVKLALDIEISTYRKLLEGEEGRLGKESVTRVRRVPTKAVVQVDSRCRRRSGPVVIKTVETQDRCYS